MSVNGQLQQIQRTLAVQDEKLDGIKEDIANARENTKELFAKSEKSGERLAALEARADGFDRHARNRGAVSGGIVTSLILGLKMVGEWLAGK